MMAANEAASEWGISDSRIRQKIDDFPKGTIRKFGKQWVVTEQGMNLVFGNRKKKEAIMMQYDDDNFKVGTEQFQGLVQFKGETWSGDVQMYTENGNDFYVYSQGNEKFQLSGKFLESQSDRYE